jgi:hypothetical protein
MNYFVVFDVTPSVDLPLSGLVRYLLRFGRVHLIDSQVVAIIPKRDLFAGRSRTFLHDSFEHTFEAPTAFPRHYQSALSPYRGSTIHDNMKKSLQVVVVFITSPTIVTCVLRQARLASLSVCSVDEISPPVLMRRLDTANDGKQLKPHRTA